MVEIHWWYFYDMAPLSWGIGFPSLVAYIVIHDFIKFTIDGSPADIRSNHRRPARSHLNLICSYLSSDSDIATDRTATPHHSYQPIVYRDIPTERRMEAILPCRDRDTIRTYKYHREQYYYLTCYLDYNTTFITFTCFKYAILFFYLSCDTISLFTSLYWSRDVAIYRISTTAFYVLQ